MILLERLHFLSRPDKLQPLRHMVKDIFLQQGFCEKDVESMVLAINEACMNVIQHAYHGRDNGEVVIEFSKDVDDLVIRIIDYANKVDITSIKSRDLDDIRPGGLGVHLIQQVMDQVEYKNISHTGADVTANVTGDVAGNLAGKDGGNVLEMRKKLGKPADSSTATKLNHKSDNIKKDLR